MDCQQKPSTWSTRISWSSVTTFAHNKQVMVTISFFMFFCWNSWNFVHSILNTDPRYHMSSVRRELQYTLSTLQKTTHNFIRQHNELANRAEYLKYANLLRQYEKGAKSNKWIFFTILQFLVTSKCEYETILTYIFQSFPWLNLNAISNSFGAFFKSQNSKLVNVLSACRIIFVNTIKTIDDSISVSFDCFNTNHVIPNLFHCKFQRFYCHISSNTFFAVPGLLCDIVVLSTREMFFVFGHRFFCCLLISWF